MLGYVTFELRNNNTSLFLTDILPTTSMRTGAKAVEPIVSKNGKIPSQAEMKGTVGIPPSSCKIMSEKLNKHIVDEQA